MAERTYWPNILISLSDWLSASADVSAGASEGPATGAVPSDLIGVTNDRDIANEAFNRGFLQGTHDMAATIAAVRSGEREASAFRETKLLEHWSQLCSDRISNDVKAAFANLRELLEGALTDVLQPFLEDLVVSKVKSTLLDLVMTEIVDAGEPILEIRAPSALHQALVGRFSEMKLALALSDSPMVEVISRAGPSRFADTADKWIRLIRKAKDD
jgi:hypothetical protein